jgi:hypothetical protein
VRLTTRTLNRTLWVRQHLAQPADLDPLAMVEHLLGLQAQDNLPPYLSLAARVRDFTPATLSVALEQRRAVRLLTMRGTVHVLTPDDALTLRPWVQPALERGSRSNQQARAARDLPVAELDAAVSAALADGPLRLAELGDRLAATFPGVPADALRHAVRAVAPLVQLPPRGLWRRSGGVVYEHVETWLGAPLAEPDVPELVRRYLRAYGPATAADMTAWSGVTRLGPVFAAMADELVQHTDEAGRVLYDVPDAPLADPDLELPTVFLGTYDNVFLGHADRSRIADDDARKQWMAVNGAAGATFFLDGMLAGQWRVTDSDLRVEPLRTPTKRQRAALDAEVDRVQALLSRP